MGTTLAWAPQEEQQQQQYQVPVLVFKIERMRGERRQLRRSDAKDCTQY